MSTLDPKALRQAFGRFMTGVTVVTTRADDGTPLGFTANSFSSVSLDPALLLVCPGRFLSSFDAFASCSHFAVNILAEGQEEVSNTFAGFKGDRFARVPHHLDAHGVPLIDGAIARFSCTTWQSLPAGDHQILIGEVQAMAQSEAPGLGYAGGQYFSLGLERAALEPASGQAICGAIIAQGDAVLLEKTPQGYRPPQAQMQARDHLRQHLSDALAARGVVTRLGPVYSVFDDAKSGTHHTYLLADSPQGKGDTLQRVALTDLPLLDYTSPAIAQMMARYGREARTRNFGLYLGDTHHGDIHTLTERT
ncbi:MAG: flavin reductase family protein [Pelagimonas sp.]|jgi:flavin reductase (DIM6/NTAB) family NADH-FMN oxidoreductase RutF|nr:flavin reductase family protein [Pelagimonas sp.]